MQCEFSGGCTQPHTVVLQVRNPYRYGIHLCTSHLYKYLDSVGLPDPRGTGEMESVDAR